MYFNEKHKERVENRGDGYIYIGSYRRNEETIDGKNKNKNKIKRGNTHIRVKCPYCGKEYDVRLEGFNKGNKCNYCCHSYENSFAYYIQQELKEPLNKYWDWKRNNLNPYLIYKGARKIVYIKCIKNNQHGSYKTTCDNFYLGYRCPYCNPFASHKVHPSDSFGSLYPEKAKYWSKNNKKSPFEISPMSNKKYKFICEKCGDEFERTLSSLNRINVGVVCRDCNSSQLETKTKNILEKYNIKYSIQVEYSNLIGLGGGNLSYDFYLPDYNLLIECQGVQHREWREGWITKEKFEKQLEHDKRKRNYAKENNINLLEIWDYDIDEIEEILIKELNKINKEVI